MQVSISKLLTESDTGFHNIVILLYLILYTGIVYCIPLWLCRVNNKDDNF
jgi:hypothetical protein